MNQGANRQRGVVLTQQGLERLEGAIAAAQDAEKGSKRFTQEDLSHRTGLSIKTVKKIREGTATVDEASLRLFFQAFEVFGLQLEAADYGLPEIDSQISNARLAQVSRSSAKIDWGEKPDASIFFGRIQDLATLTQWVTAEHCRLVTLLGMGGIGKTSLVAKLADQIHSQFDYVIWRSLREAPPLDEILVRLIQFLSDQQETEINLPTRLGERIIRLLHYLREHRCLLVLDNLEAILQAEAAGHYRESYEGYGELIQRIGNSEHQSCLLLTSRECPRELAPMAGDRLPVRLWSVSGIDTDAGQELLRTKGLEMDEEDAQGQELVRRYSGNPQALHLVATAIQKEFFGDVNDFLQEQVTAVEDVRSLLDQHLSRLAPSERSVLFWLAINREPVDLDELMEDLLPPANKQEVRSALRGLSDRYLIETVGQQHTLQNVIMEFTTDRFVERARIELENQKFDLLHTHALIKATAKNYVREAQARLILKPVTVSIFNLEQKVNSFLKIIRQHPDLRNGYISGSLLNILCQTRLEVYSADLSTLTLRQTYLEGMKLYNLNLANAYFVRSSLTQRFSIICALNFKPNGKVIVTGDCNGYIQAWDVQDKQLLVTFKGHHLGIRSVAFSPNEQFLASGGEDATIRFWDIQKKQCLWMHQEHTNWVRSIAFSPDSQLLASGSSDTTIRLWDMRERRCIHVFEGHLNSVRSVAFSPDGQLLASGSNDTTVRLWDIGERQCIHIFEGHLNWVQSVFFSSNGQLLASGGGDATVRLWDVCKKQTSYVLEGHKNPIRSLAFSPSNQVLVSSSGDDTMRLWDIQQMQCLHVFSGHTSWIRSVVFSPNGKFIASSSEDAKIRLWDVWEQQCFQVFEGHKSPVRSVSFSADSQFLVSGSEDETVRLWDIQKKQCTQIIKGHTNSVLSVAFSPNGQFIASGSNDNTIRIWDIYQKQYVQVIEGHDDSVRVVAFSFDGRFLASGIGATVKIWKFNRHLNEYQGFHTFIGHMGWIRSLAFSPNDQLLTSSSADGTIRLWDILRKRFLHVFEEHTDDVRSVSFSPNSLFLASSSVDGTIRLWNLDQCQCLHVFDGQSSHVESVSFSPDSQLLASSSNEGRIRVWNVHTKLCLQVLQVPRPYEGTNITGVRGLTEAQRASMFALGAIDESVV